MSATITNATITIQPTQTGFVQNVLDSEHVETAAFRLLLKFHRLNATCGKDGMHWAECDALVDACGWESWESWLLLRAS